MSPKEFYYAMKAVSERKRLDYQHSYEVARYTAVSIINMTSQILKSQIKDPRELTRFPWEIEKGHKVQTQEELINQVKSLATSLGASRRTKKPGDPPLHLAPQHRNK